nr:zinc dependent phospholipase C family protein [uncultured Oscillibacter sp.]
MQKRSHTLLASALLRGEEGFGARRFELAFLFGSFQPDCNPLSYLKGSLRAYKLCGHNYTNSRRYINAHIAKLQRRSRWTMWQYYTLGKLTHYLADAFTYPHNEDFPDGLMDHHRYETQLRQYLAAYLAHRALWRGAACQDLATAIEELHCQYMSNPSDLRRDVHYILRATELLMAGCLPVAA